jgi:hypothetical protein
LTKHQPDRAARGRQAFELVQQHGSTRMASIPNLYKTCMDGVAIAAEVIAKGIEPPETLPLRYSSLTGQASAVKFTAATLDDVLSIILAEQPDHTWTFDIVVNDSLIYGIAEGESVASREAAIEGARKSLSLLGHPWEAAEGYEPCENPDDWCQLRIGSGAATKTYRVPSAPEEYLREAVEGGMKADNCSFAVIQARLANLVCNDGGIEEHPVAACFLANLGWTHINQSILESFCAKYKVDMIRDLYRSTHDAPSELVN